MDNVHYHEIAEHPSTGLWDVIECGQTVNGRDNPLFERVVEGQSYITAQEALAQYPNAGYGFHPLNIEPRVHPLDWYE